VSAVYFLRDDECGGLIKIGYAVDVVSRRRVIQKQLRRPIQIVATFKGGFREEAALHDLFRAHHSHSEWFKSCPELEALIGAIRAGTFDPSTLQYAGSWLRREAAKRGNVARLARLDRVAAAKLTPHQASSPDQARR
jgi:hypothetical protein